VADLPGMLPVIFGELLLMDPGKRTASGSKRIDEMRVVGQSY